MNEDTTSVDTDYVEPGVGRISVRTAAVMLAFTLVFTAFMAGTYKATEPLLAASAQAEKLRLIGEVLPPASYDNDLLADKIVIPPQSALDTREEKPLYRARRGATSIALVFEASAPDGYSGGIGLLLAVDADGHLLAQRVISHRETPGLGDYIDPKKDRNKQRPWITQFNNLGFDTVPQAQWKVRKDGGRFDQMNGATISARAVTNASRRALAWIEPRRVALFSLPNGSRFTVADEGAKAP
jgi:electron transport complex protein RnfG